MRLSSSAFQNNTLIPTKYAYHGVVGGKNISVPLAWSDVPPDTHSFALSMIDPHPVAGNWVHWLLINIPKNIQSLTEGVSTTLLPVGVKALYNFFGTLGYSGPQPPKGSGQHPYVITLYALSVERLDLSQNSSLTAFEKVLEGAVLASATLTGLYER